MTSNIKISAVDHPIKSVTVFKSSKAEVVRTFSLDLKRGQNKIDITNLPSVIDTQSVRVSGLGEARLLDVVCTIGDNKAAIQDKDSPSEIIRILEAQKELLENEQDVREQEANLLVSYARTLTGEFITPGQMGTFLDSFVTRGRMNLEAINEIKEKIVDIDRQIEKEEARKREKKGEAHGEVTVVVVAQNDGNVELRLTYIVSNATWEPAYELHATTENGKPSSSVSLHYRARVTQSTGEAWTNAALTLSTVSSDHKSIPILTSMNIRPFSQRAGGFGNNVGAFGNAGGLFGGKKAINDVSTGLFGQTQQQQQQVQQSQQVQFQQRQQQQPLFGGGGGFGGTSSFPPPAASNAFGGGPFGGAAPVLPGHNPYPPGPSADAPAANEDPEDSFEEVGVPAPFTEPTTVVGESPLAISYSVEGQSTIVNDGVAHQVSVAVLPFEAKVTHVTVPCIEAVAYLQCQVKNTSDYRLLPGAVTVILDDSYVSKTWVQDVNKGDTFDCTLGADSSARITYSRTSKNVKASAGTFAEVTNTTTFTSTITIENKHQFAISDLTVRDVVPMADDKRIKVILRKPEGLADAKDGKWVDLKKDGLKVGWGKVVGGKGGEKEGKFEWLWKVEAGAKVTLQSEFEVKAPADVRWNLPMPSFPNQNVNFFRDD